MYSHNYYEVNEIKGGGHFKYVLSISPIDFFALTLTKDQIIENIRYENSINGSQDNTKYYLNGFNNIDELEAYISNYIVNIEEKPHTIRYMCTPEMDGGNSLELAVIAKISNNGTCFIFSNNKGYLELINSK